MARTNKLEGIRAKYQNEAPSQNTQAPRLENPDDELSPLAELVTHLKPDYEKDKIYYGNPDEFKLYPNEKIRLKPHTGDKKELLRETIKKDGVLDPALVWIRGNDKIILAGQNRNIICKEENMLLPYIVMDIQSEKQADRIVVVTNLNNRQHNEMLPSELCSMLSCLIESYDDSAYKGDIIKDINSEFKLDRNQIYRTLSLKKLIPRLLDMLDAKQMPMYAGYTLASVSHEKQAALYEFIQSQGINKVSKKNVDALMSRQEMAWDTDFLCKAFGLEAQERKRGKRNTIIENARLQPYLFEGELIKAQDAVIKTMNMRYKIKQKLMEHGIKYSDEEVLKAVDAYLDNK